MQDKYSVCKSETMFEVCVSASTPLW